LGGEHVEGSDLCYLHVARRERSAAHDVRSDRDSRI
jgi:hypothetical protein